MAWARTKLMIHDDLLRPLPDMNVELEGVSPEKLYKAVPKLAATIFRTHRDNIQEKTFHWTKSDPAKFKIEWQLDKDLDKFSYYWIELVLEGKSSKGIGNVKITFAPALRTEYPQDTIWHRSLIYEFIRMTWHTLFYASKRDHYLKEGRRLSVLFMDKLKELAK